MGEFFDARYEQESIDKGLAQQQGVQGTTLPWFFFDKANSHPDPIYGEGGRKWDGPYPMPVFSISRTTGGRNDQEGEGMYPVDSLAMWLSYAQAEKAGLLPTVDETHDHLSDRFVFDNEVWTPSTIAARNWLGQGARRSMIVVTATQIMGDEMEADEPDFLAWAAQPYREPDTGSDVA